MKTANSSKIHFVLIIVLITGFFGLSCGESYTIQKANPEETVYALGFSINPDQEQAKAEATARAQKLLAHLMAIDSVNFTYISFKDDYFVDIKYNEPEIEGNVVESKAINPNLYMVKLSAKRPANLVGDMRSLQTIESSVVVSKGLFGKRVGEGEKEALVKAAYKFAKIKFGKADVKFSGTIAIPRMSIKYDDAEVEVSLDAAFIIGKTGKPNDEDKGATLFHNWQVFAEQKTGESTEAVATFQQAVKLSPKADYYHKFGRYFLLKNDFKTALPNLEKAVELEGQNVEYLESLKRCYISMGQDEKAAELDAKINELGGTHGDSSEWTGDDLVQEEKYYIKKTTEQKAPDDYQFQDADVKVKKKKNK